jgi:hypothetical protein
MGREHAKIVCRSYEEAVELLNAYKTITRIRGYPKYKGHVEENTLYLEIED